MKRYVFLMLVSLLMTSCAHVLSEQYVKSAATGVSFSQIQANPEAYLNKTFILGGTIVETTVSKETSEIEVIQNPIDQYGAISDPDASEGRYLIATSKHLDPQIYRKGRRITFAGKLIGSRKKLMDGVENNYPVFQAEQIYLWRSKHVYAYPYPAYYGDPFLYPYPYYFYDPYWYRPYYPWP